MTDSPAVLIAEDLLLLLTDDDSGKTVVEGAKLDRVLAGAMLVEAVLAGRVVVAPEGGELKAGRLAVTDATPTGDQVPDGVLTVVGEKARKPDAAVEAIAKGLRAAVVGRLVARGWIRETKTKALGMTWGTRYPAVDASHEDQLRAEVAEVLLGGAVPSERTGAVVSMLSVADAVRHAVPASDKAQRKAAEARAKEIAAGDWVAAGVKKSLDALLAAYLATAVIAATVTTTVN